MKMKHLAYFVLFFVLLSNSSVTADTIIVDDKTRNNHTSIKKAVNDANSGDNIVVYPGKYVENIVIDKEISIESKSNNPENTVIQSKTPEKNVIQVNSNKVNISGFKIMGVKNTNQSGVNLDRVEKCNISNSIFSKNFNGVSFFKSECNTLTNNTVKSNKNHGIYLQKSENNRVINNIVGSNSRYGIFLQRSINNNIITNHIHNHSNNGILVDHSNNNLLKYNKCFDNEYGIYIHSSQSNKLKVNNISNNKIGIQGGLSNKNELINNSIIKNRVGIFLYKCNGNDIIANIINENIHKGILLQYSVDNKISNNTLNSNGLGIIMEDFSSNNTVHYNSLSKNRGNIRANHSINQIKNNYMNDNSSQNINSDGPEIPFINSTFLLILIATAFVFLKNKRGNKRK